MAKLDLFVCFVLLTLVSVTFGQDVIVPVTKPSNEWWSNTIIYQVYPGSFKDSNNDGVGDLKGITQKLDHFVDLGVQIVWLNPIYKSPMIDLGFDVENHTVIDPIFGTMGDFEELISEMNKRSLKLIMEFVPNHSSDKCEWFLKSIKQEGKYKDYYVWHNATNQEEVIKNSSVIPIPPNNWISYFGGSAWSWNTERRQFYLHQYNDKQPDFNLRNPDVHKEFFNIMEFWLDRGVSGFRFNAVGKLYENKDFHNNTYRKGKEGSPFYSDMYNINTSDLPENVDAILEWRQFLDNYSKRKNTFSRLLAAEAHFYVCPYSINGYYGNITHPGAQVPFNYVLMNHADKNYLVQSIDHAIKMWVKAVPKNSVHNWVMENLDNNRIASEFGPEIVPIFTALKLALPGIDITYYGSEIGMENTHVRPKQVRDSYGLGGKREKKTRDYERCPMQWNDLNNAGFTDGQKPWLPINPNYYTQNVEAQKKIPTSNYNFYKRMSRLRKTDTLKYGSLQTYNISESLYLIKRSLPEHESYLVVMNFGSETQTIILSNVMRNINEKLYVYLASANVAYNTGDTVSTITAADKPLKLRPQSVVVLSDREIRADLLKNAANTSKQISLWLISAFCALLLINY